MPPAQIYPVQTCAPAPGVLARDGPWDRDARGSWSISERWRGLEQALGDK